MNAKKKKLYGGVLLIGLLALTLDRFLLAEPASATAAVPRKARAEGPPADAEQEPSTGPILSAAAFPGLLPAPETGDDIRDAFTLSGMGRRLMLGEDEADFGAPGSGRHGGRRGASAADFKARHELHAVMTGTATRVAIVDGRWLSLEEAVDGCFLTDITGQTAVFECWDGTAELSVTMFGTPSP